MTYLSVIEKISILFDTMVDFYFILVFSVLLMVLTFMYIAKKINLKKYTFLMILSFVVVFGISIISNYEVLSNTFDDFTTIFFGNIYFPSIYVYIGVLVISFIAFIISIFNVLLNKIYKIINSIMFVVNNVLFVVILNIIAKNNIDIFSVNSLYSNTSLVAVLELSMGLFILWILSLIVVYTTNIICINFANKKVNKNELNKEVFGPVLEISNDSTLDVKVFNDDVTSPAHIENIVNNEIEKLDSIEELKTDKYIIKDELSVENNIENNFDVTFNDLLNCTVPAIYNDNRYNNEPNLIDKKNVYDDSYNKARSQTTFNDVLTETNNIDESVLLVEKSNIIEQDKVSQEEINTNTIALNNLTLEDNTNVIEDNNYSVDDYKKIIKMLTEIKNYANGTNINIDDAVAIGLINNYSIDDCMKFKNILENNIN